MTDFDQAVESRQANSATPEEVGNILQIDLPSLGDGESAKPTPHFEDRPGYLLRIEPIPENKIIQK